MKLYEYLLIQNILDIMNIFLQGRALPAVWLTVAYFLKIIILKIIPIKLNIIWDIPTYGLYSDQKKLSLKLGLKNTP